MSNVACAVQGGCIIRAGFLDDIKNAYKRNPDLENLVLDDWFANKLAERQDAWRDVVKIAITNGESSAWHIAFCSHCMHCVVLSDASVPWCSHDHIALSVKTAGMVSLQTFSSLVQGFSKK